MITQIFCWTDSTITYYWITLVNHKEWKQWVDLRVNKIRDIIPDHYWNHVPGELNLTDLATRGIKPTTIINNKLWWHGPQFLKLTEESWPKTDNVTMKHTVEMKKEKYMLLLNLNERNMPRISYVINIDKYSSLTKLLRITAYVMEFMNKLKNTINGKIIRNVGDSAELSTKI